MSLNGFKESVSATHFCHLCDIRHDYLEEDICYDFPAITVAEYRGRSARKNFLLSLGFSFVAVPIWSSFRIVRNPTKIYRKNME